MMARFSGQSAMPVAGFTPQSPGRSQWEPSGNV